MDVSFDGSSSDDFIDEIVAHAAEDLLESEDDGVAEPGGSRLGRIKSKNRQRDIVDGALFRDYFGPEPTYNRADFERRFCLRKERVLAIVGALQAIDPYFTQRPDAVGRLGFTGLAKVCVALQTIGYGDAADQADQYFRMAESTVLETVDRFVQGVISEYGAVYLRVPTNDDVRRILAASLRKGWPGKLGSIDCMSLSWKNCPYSLQGAHKGRKGRPTLTLEAVVDADLWFWHIYFGVPGSADDINVLQSSPLLKGILLGVFPPSVEYNIGDTRMRRPYFLADGIYPRSPLFVQAYRGPDSEKKRLFNTFQEAERKEVERAFGILQSRFRFLSTANSVELWDKERIQRIVTASTILHNMTVEDRLAEIQGDETNGEAVAAGATATLVGAEDGAQFEWQRAAVTAEGQAPRPGSFAGMCLANVDFQNELEWHNLRARLADFIFEAHR
jgi:hypothetical protein